MKKKRKKYIAKEYQEIMVDFMHEHPRCAVWAGMGMGKLHDVATPVLTPSGWVPIGDIRTGDEVIGQNGLPTKVIGVYPNGIKPNYKVAFNDGSWVHAGLEHLWSVATPHDRDSHRTLSTGQLLDFGLYDTSGNRKWSIPLVQPVQHLRKDLPVEPYFLGVLLGDGCLQPSGGITLTTDREIAANWAGRVTEHGSEGIVNLTPSDKELRGHLRSMGLRGTRSWEKKIPPVYLLGDVGQRLALLQGLLDTDGHPMESGGVEFSSTSENLTDGVVELANSLGGIARKSKGRFTRYQGGVGRESWRVNVKLPVNFEPFRLKRKLDKWTKPTKYKPLRALSSITYSHDAESVCIRVEAEDCLYVVKDHIVTHNTSTVLTLIDQQLMMGYDKPKLVIAPLLVAKTTWEDEALKWEHTRGIRVVPIIGTELERRRAMATKAEVYTINYEQLPWLVDYWGDRWPYEDVIADESTKLKNYRTRQGGQRAKALSSVAHSKIKRFIELTGTPAPNGLKDLWGQIWMLDGGKRLGRTYSAFEDRWFRMPRYGDNKTPQPLAHSEQEIHGALKDICLTVNAADWVDLEDPVVVNRYVAIPPRARDLYKRMEDEFFFELEGHDVEAATAAVKSGKLLQLCVDEETEVLTHSGWKPMKDLEIGDLLWDGVEWVNFYGLTSPLRKAVIECDGVYMTPEHRVLTICGWKTAKEIEDEGFTRAEVRLPDGFKKGGVAEPQGYVALPLRLRQGGGNAESIIAEQPPASTKKLWVQAGEMEPHTRYGRHEKASHMERAETEMLESKLPGLSELWRAWHRRLRGVGELVRDFLRGHKTRLLGHPLHRAYRQFEGVLEGELSVGYGERTRCEHEGEPIDNHTARGANFGASCGALRSAPRNDTRPVEQVRIPPVKSGLDACKRVRDVIHSGPRNRFTVRGREGQILIVHNCNGAVYVDPLTESDDDPRALKFKEVHDAKIQELESIINEACGMPVLVATNFKSDTVRLTKAFPKSKVLTSANGHLLMPLWNEGKIPLMFAHPACLHGDTEVLTELRGWQRIVDVSRNDRVFDGIEYVAHDGCSYSGYKKVVECFGLTATPDHKLLVKGKWKEVQNVRSSEGTRREAVYEYKGDDDYLSSMLNLRGGERDTLTKRAEEQSTEEGTLRVLHKGYFPQHDEYPVLADMAWNEDTGSGQNRQGLRRARHLSMRFLAILQELLQGYVAFLRGGANDREDRCKRNVHERELHMGVDVRPAIEQEDHEAVRVPGKADSLSGVMQGNRLGQMRTNQSVEQGNERGRRSEVSPSLLSPETAERAHVYDLVNCGPRNRFTVRNKEGEAFISHNSAGHGLSLQDGGNILVFFGLGWNLEYRLQVIERIGPMRQLQAGHNRPVFIYNIVARGTIDELVLERMDGKKSVQDILLNAMAKRRRG